MTWRPMALVPALLLAACSSASPSETNAAQGVRSTLTKQRVQVTEVRCAKLHRATYGCAARVASGGRYVCLISVGAPAACALRNWSAYTEGAFLGGCSGTGAGDGYCVCALREVMRKNPDPRRLPGSAPGSEWVGPGVVGADASQSKNEYPGCRHAPAG
jgi:hypothetical protein